VVGWGVALAHPATVAGTAVAAEQVNRDSVSSAQPAWPRSGGYPSGNGQTGSGSTGMALTSGGEIPTNNHAFAGSTNISVTVVTTGRTYPATVVGTDATDDIAVLQLSGASGLTVANFGAGGTPAASPGIVTAITQTITTQADGIAASETLTGLIETNADIQSGD
jgi:S1-C subfamily serine protease